MKNLFKKLFSGEAFYSMVKTVGDLLVNMTEQLIKQWLGTVVGGRFMKWLTDIMVTKFYDETIRIFTRVGVIRLGYHFDDSRADRVIIRLQLAEEANDEELYMRTLNDALRGGKLPKP
jgi:hypothetical protein